MSNIVNKFIEYVKFDTESNNSSKSVPSTNGQIILGNHLVSVLKKMGIDNAYINEYGIVYANITKNINFNAPSIGFIAHLDTASDVSGHNVNPKIIKKYDGLDFSLDENNKYIMSTKEYPALLNHIGKDLIVTDGSTLLGADDKAGVASIMELIEFLVNTPDFKHGDIKIAFTPDEEIGCGTDHFDLKEFGADFAYTIDGGSICEVEYENFNAYSLEIYIEGVSIHPGSAKDKMINALHLAMEIHSMLPRSCDPALTSGFEGFNHLTDLNGSVDNAKMEYIIRNHDKELLNKQINDFKNIENYIKNKYPTAKFNFIFKEQYKNMKEYLKDSMYVVELAYKALKSLDINPISNPIRGGTDGARLTYNGLPCPNLGAGGYNFHSRYEYLVIDELEKSVELLKKIIEFSLDL